MSNSRQRRRVPDGPRTGRTRVDPELATEVSDLLHLLGRRLRQAAAVELDDLGLTGARARALRLLGRRGQPLRMSELARSLDVVPRSATSIVDALEAAGLVARRADPGDRRVTLVALTPAGRRVLGRLRSRRRSAAADLLGRLEPADQDQLRRLLQVLAEPGSRGPQRGPSRPTDRG